MDFCPPTWLALSQALFRGGGWWPRYTRECEANTRKHSHSRSSHTTSFCLSHRQAIRKAKSEKHRVSSLPTRNTSLKQIPRPNPQQQTTKDFRAHSTRKFSNIAACEAASFPINSLVHNHTNSYIPANLSTPQSKMAALIPLSARPAVHALLSKREKSWPAREAGVMVVFCVVFVVASGLLALCISRSIAKRRAARPQTY